jgi:putative FmdB family regulatory protein
MTYDFKCPECGKTFEIKSGMNEVAKLKPLCLECGRELQRIFSRPGIQFIGSGFYCNDYKGKQ